MLGRVRFIERGARQLDREAPAGRHRIARIDDQVHDQLLHLAGVDEDIADGLVADEREIDVCADQSAQHVV
jgi:hypothetical protein